MDLATCDAEIFELAANPGDVAFFFFGLMFGIEARNDAIDGEDIEHIQALEHGGRESVVRIIVGLMTAGDVRITLFERNEAAKFERIDTRVAVATYDRQGALRLNVDLMVKGPSEIRAKSVSTRVEMERTGRLRGHTYHLLNVTTERLMLLNLL